MTMTQITDKIKTFEDACKALNIDASIPDLSVMPESYQKAMLAHYKLCVIAEADAIINNDGHFEFT